VGCTHGALAAFLAAAGGAAGAAAPSARTTTLRLDGAVKAQRELQESWVERTVMVAILKAGRGLLWVV